MDGLGTDGGVPAGRGRHRTAAERAERTAAIVESLRVLMEPAARAKAVRAGERLDGYTELLWAARAVVAAGGAGAAEDERVALSSQEWLAAGGVDHPEVPRRGCTEAERAAADRARAAGDRYAAGTAASGGVPAAGKAPGR